jgi:hypothetical protein
VGHGEELQVGVRVGKGVGLEVGKVGKGYGWDIGVGEELRLGKEGVGL